MVQSARAFVNSGVPGGYDTSSQGFEAAEGWRVARFWVVGSIDSAL